MPKKPFEPNFKTPRFYYSREENNKLLVRMRQDEMYKDYRDKEKSDVEWHIEQVSKSYGIYLEFNRAQTGKEKDWMYMIRIGIPGGGPINREQWLTFDELSSKYTTDPSGHTSLRFTTRQAIQYHWVKKKDVIDIVKSLAEKNMFSLNACGDNTRNVLGCPLSRYSDIFNAVEWAEKAGQYFQLPLDPFIKIFAIDPNYLRKPEESFQYGPSLLNRKFKIAFSAAHRNEDGIIVPDNCVELRTNDLGIAPIIENDKVVAFQIYVGGGQGERNGKPSMAALGEPLGITTEDKLLQVLDAVVAVHQEWGDRQNRFWARVKYVVKAKGIDWYRDQVTARLGFPLEKPNPDLDYGARHLHHGWHQQPSNGKWTYGAYLENGRVIDNESNGKLKIMIREVMKKYSTELMITPNQDALFTNVDEEQKGKFESDLKKYGFGKRNGKGYSTLRILSGACVGRDTCRLTYTDSEKFEPELIDKLEEMGWGDMKESIGITGCERQCFRPATKTIGIIGTGLNRYQFKLFGDETGKFQGTPLISSDGSEIYLRSVPREKVALVIDSLFKHYQNDKQNNESLGAFHRRIGANAIIAHLKENEPTKELMTKPFNTDCVID